MDGFWTLRGPFWTDFGASGGHFLNRSWRPTSKKRRREKDYKMIRREKQKRRTEEENKRRREEENKRKREEERRARRQEDKKITEGGYPENPVTQEPRNRGTQEPRNPVNRLARRNARSDPPPHRGTACWTSPQVLVSGFLSPGSCLFVLVPLQKVPQRPAHSVGPPPGLRLFWPGHPFFSNWSSKIKFQTLSRRLPRACG